MDIGPRLKIARESIGYTQKKASEESGIGETSISEFENSTREPKFSYLAKLAEVYRKPIDFFLSERLPPPEIPLWREPPNTEEEKKQIEAQFLELCEQYHKLEVLNNELPKVSFPRSYVTDQKEFDYREANSLAEKAQKEFSLGDIPSGSLKHILEERYYVKIFHLPFSGSGSAISAVSPTFGLAILLNRNSVLWRRNFDLAHELFHLLTWEIFRQAGSEAGSPTDYEEKLANAFASRLLLPTDAVKDRIEAAKDANKKVAIEDLDEIAREFGVSLDALLWRILYLYNKSEEEIQQYLEKAQLVKTRVPRHTDTPDQRPERFKALAQRALRDGRLSLMQFAKYMGISYKKAQEYLTEDEDFTGEKVSIPIT